MTTVSPEVIEKWKADATQYVDDLPIGQFHEWTVDDVLRAFVAARQSAVIELPDKVSVGFGTNHAFTYILIGQLIEKLEAQGYQVNFNQPIQG